MKSGYEKVLNACWIKDIENINASTLGKNCPGRLNVHSSALNKTFTSTDPDNNNITRTVQKTRSIK